MQAKEIGNRGIIFTFEPQECPIGGSTVYLINGKNTIYLCDTHLGSASMEPIIAYLKQKGLADKDVLIFFSHSDWDHIWGAGAFPDATVISHRLCRQRITQRSMLELLRYEKHRQGDVKLILPSVTFQTSIFFEEDQVEFFYTPGHTVDSACCRDHMDNTIYVGDLVERPAPTVDWHDVESFIETLENLKALNAATYVSFHSGLVETDDFSHNISFLRNYLEGLSRPPRSQQEELQQKQFTLLMYEDAIRQALGEKFDYGAFQQELWQGLDLDYRLTLTELLKGVEHEELKTALEAFLIQC